MPRVVVTEGAVRVLEHCRRFLVARNPQAARRASRTIERFFTQLEMNPSIGRPVLDLPELRELVISFGDSGYVALYRHEPVDNAIYVLAFRHQKEAGY